HAYTLCVPAAHSAPAYAPLLSRHPPTTEVYPLPLHDALPIYSRIARSSTSDASCTPAKNRITASFRSAATRISAAANSTEKTMRDRKSTRLNSSHVKISYAVFCLKKKKHIESVVNERESDKQP